MIVRLPVPGRYSCPSCPGDVVVSSAVKDLVVGSDITVEKRCQHELKGVPGTWTILVAQPSDNQGIRLRPGLHTGEIEIRPTDVLGIAVHTANRIAELAEPGEILVSRTVVDLTRRIRTPIRGAR